MAFPETSGTAQSSGKPWKKREYVLETQEQYPQKIFFDFFGDKADQYPLQVGQVVKLSFDIRSREYNGRWYTSISGWRAEGVDEGGAAARAPAAAAPAQNPYGAPTIPPVDLAPSSPSDDLPF